MITSNEKIVRLSKAEPGELVRLSMQKNVSFAIVLAQDNRQTILAVLEPLSELGDRPFHFAPSGNTFVISYGRDWYLEIVPDVTFSVGYAGWSWASGAIKLEGENWILSTHPSLHDHESEPLYYNLKTNEMVNAPASDHSAPVAHWRIWRSWSEYQNQVVTPLVEVKAVPVS
jgi:hypothetical protein